LRKGCLIIADKRVEVLTPEKELLEAKFFWKRFFKTYTKKGTSKTVNGDQETGSRLVIAALFGDQKRSQGNKGE